MVAMIAAQPQPTRRQRLRAGITTTFAIVLGVNLRDEVESVLNSGRPLKYVAILTLVLPTVAFFLLHSIVGFLRWRLQRELWRRDVARLEAGGADPEVSPPR